MVVLSKAKFQFGHAFRLQRGLINLNVQVLLSPDYLPAMRRRRSSDPMGDTASNLGNAMDELMRHQPSLKQAATKAIITLLEEVMHVKLLTNIKYTRNRL